MKHVSISLSDAEQAFVDAQVAEGKYPNAETCVAALVRAGTRAWAQERFEALLMEGLASPGAPWTTTSMDEIRRAARARL